MISEEIRVEVSKIRKLEQRSKYSLIRDLIQVNEKLKQCYRYLKRGDRVITLLSTMT